MATFPVRCECGKTYQVPGSAAGTAIACDCRRTVEVPSFAKLKSSVGESSVSIDLVIRHMLANGELPVETDCVICFRTTANLATYQLECEREELTRSSKMTWLEFLATLFFSPLRLFLIANRFEDARMMGRDVILQLPIRICKECEPDLKTGADVRTVMQKTDLYRQLFEKYPDSRVR